MIKSTESFTSAGTFSTTSHFMLIGSESPSLWGGKAFSEEYIFKEEILKTHIYSTGSNERANINLND